MADLVRDDVRLGEVAGRTEAGAQVAEEVEIEVELAVGGAVERSHRRAGHAAGGLDRAAEQSPSGFCAGLFVQGAGRRG
jgi:hypothetical protein